jgi:hypothetical protein
MALAAHQLRRQAELVAEGAGEGLVRAVAGVQRHRQDVASAGGQLAGRLGQSAAADRAHHRPAGGHAEQPAQMEPRHAGGLGDRVERDLRPELVLDEPNRPLDRRHPRFPSAFAGTLPMAEAVRLIAVAPGAGQSAPSAATR